jgi:hypothetical protein
MLLLLVLVCQNLLHDKVSNCNLTQCHFQFGLPMKISMQTLLEIPFFSERVTEKLITLITIKHLVICYCVADEVIHIFRCTGGQHVVSHPLDAKLTVRKSPDSKVVVRI